MSNYNVDMQWNIKIAKFLSEKKRVHIKSKKSNYSGQYNDFKYPYIHEFFGTFVQVSHISVLKRSTHNNQLLDNLKNIYKISP